MGLKVVPVTGPFESRQPAVITLQVIFISIALLVYLLRIYIRTHILHSLGPDDYIMGVAMTKFGWWTHLYSIPRGNFIPLLRLIWTFELLFTLSTSFVKLSILFFYLRVAATITYRRVIYGSIALVAAWLVTFTCVVVFQCHPVSKHWNPTSTQYISPEIALGMHGITNTLTDIYVFVLPMPMVWNLHLPRR